MKKGPAFNLKKLIHKLHLYLGLSTGLIVFIISITGCLYAFQEEIQDFCQHYRFCEEQDLAVLPPSFFEEKARQRLPEWHLHAINYPGDGKNVEAIFYGFEPEEHYYVSYHNPYTAEIAHVQNMDQTFSAGYCWGITTCGYRRPSDNRLPPTLP